MFRFVLFKSFFRIVIEAIMGMGKPDQLRRFLAGLVLLEYFDFWG